MKFGMRCGCIITQFIQKEYSANGLKDTFTKAAENLKHLSTSFTFIVLSVHSSSFHSDYKRKYNLFQESYLSPFMGIIFEKILEVR